MDETNETVINLAEYGCINRGEEFYLDLDHKFNSMDELDKSRTLLHFSTLIIKEDSKLHPVVIMKLLENIQNCEINCAKIKTVLANVKVNGMSCKLCGFKMPTMTMKMWCEGINKKCPHDEIEINIEE